MKVLVLAGGRSAERDVSLASGIAVSDALTKAGCDVSVFDPGVSEHAVAWSEKALPITIGAEPPPSQSTRGADSDRGRIRPADLALAGLDDVDVVFIALHGGAGEDGHLQALLDAAGVAYAGSGMLASALAMDKAAAKRIFVAEGIPTPNWQILDESAPLPFDEVEDILGLPIVVKPNAQGSTVGLSIVQENALWDDALIEGFRWGGRLLAEEFIPGRELTVAILGDQALPVVEIIPSHDLYDYECKYTPGRTRYVCPADLTPGQTRTLQEQALLAFRALGCRGFGRVDFRMSPAHKFECLEVNTIPGMTATSLVPKAAEAAGIPFPELVRRICGIAMQDHSRHRGSSRTRQLV